MQTSVDRPRFRQDLVAEPIEDGGAKFIDVMDPDSGRLFRFFEVEYSLACAMDGQRDIAGIARWAEEELGLKANPNEIRTVIATLGDLGYLESGAAAAAAAATPTEKPAAARDEYLKPGVVAAKPAAAAAMPAAEVELGHAGTARAAKAEELPRAPELELGAPGTSAPAARAPVAKTEDIGLGVSGPGRPQVSDVSIDLADQVGIGLDDVKEAVRASQVMKAVEVPPELAAELEAPKPAAKVEAPKAAVPEPKKPEVTPTPKIEAKAEPKPEPKKGEPKKVAAKPVVEEKRPVTAPPPPAKSGTSPVLIALLVLAILGAGAFLAYKFVFAKKSESTETSVKDTPPPPPPQPEPPPVETAKLAIEQPAPEEIKPAGAGQIAVLVPNDTVVKMGDPIAKLVGFKSLEADVAAVEKTVAKAKTDIANAEKERDAAQAAGNKVGATNSEKKIDSSSKVLLDAEAKLGTKKAALDKFLIKAPAAGKVTAVAKANAKITPTDVVATLTREPLLVTTFKKAEGATADAHVRLGIKGSEQQLSCTVVQADPDGTKIACAKDAAPEGTEVTYLGVDPSAAPPPPPADPIETHDTGSAGSAATGSATPEAGSAAPTEPETKAEPEKKKAPARPRPRPRPRPAQPPVEGETGGETTAPAPEPAPAPGSDG